MAVNLSKPDPAKLHPVAGVTLGWAEAGIRKANRKDLLLIALEPRARVAGVFTQNAFCAAPVTVCRAHLAAGKPVRALVINTGNANAGTGEPGMVAANAMCEAVAALMGCDPAAVLPFSTGVILESLPVDRITAGLPACKLNLAPDNWAVAAETIMTTDTIPKAASRQIRIGDALVTVTGISKGSGMIHPNMATMLGYVATDAPVAQAALEDMVRYAADRSFNCITVDGDTSTNDSFMLIASGKASMPEITPASGDAYIALRDAVTAISTELAQAIVRDGEGATKLMTITVEEGKTQEECRRVAKAIAHSPLVKTAFFASDPNLGRILAAIGYSGVPDLDVARIKLYLGEVLVATEGGRNPEYREEDGVRVMKESEILVRVTLGRGAVAATIWTCDLSYDYVKINADYRS